MEDGPFLLALQPHLLTCLPKKNKNKKTAEERGESLQKNERRNRLVVWHGFLKINTKHGHPYDRPQQLIY